MAGYGVDLALKRTDYIVIDDRENTHDGEAKSDHLALPSNTESGLKPLNASELADLSIKTASYIMRRKDPLMTLYNCTQDFPKYAQEMSIQEISEDFVQEHNKNRHQVVPAGYNVVWVNGLQADTRNFNAFYLLRVLRKERNVVKQMVDLGITPGQAIRILSHPATAAVVSDDQPQRYDMRDEIEGGKAVVWLNDLEKDKKYQAWPTKVAAVSIKPAHGLIRIPCLTEA